MSARKNETHKEYLARRRQQRQRSMSGRQGTEIERFENQYIPEPNSGCWLWIGAAYASGYGKLGRASSGLSYAAHRFAWMHFRGPIPEGMYILHKCDNPCCVNPDHLYVGTQQNNVDDMWNRGRIKAKRGEQKYNAILTDDMVRAIRQTPRFSREIGLKYGIGCSHFYKIKLRKAWRHVP